MLIDKSDREWQSMSAGFIVTAEMDMPLIQRNAVFPQ
jgi:hypothetical protein